MADGDFFGIGGGLLGNGGAGFNPSQAGLLNFGLALMQSRPGERFSGALGRAGQAGVGGYMQGKEQALQDQYQSERAGLLGAQRSKIEAEQAQRLQQQRYFDSLRTPQMPADAMSGGGGPSNANAQMVGQARQFDPYQALLAGIPIDQVKALAESGNFGKSEVGNFQTVRGPDGMPTVVGYDKFGGVKQTGQTPFEKAAFQNTGGQTLALDPLTGQVRTALQNTQTPDGAASNAVAWANNGVARGNLGVAQGNLNVSQQRLQMDRDTPKGQYDSTRGVMIDPRTGIATPVFGSDGQPLGAKADKPTEFQGKSAIFGARAGESNKVLNDLEGKGVSDPGVIKSVVSSAPLVGEGLGSAMNMLSPYLGGPNAQQQQVEQARRDFVNAVLRQESGAAISPGEFANASKQYFPQPGDEPSVVAQKARNRALTVQGLLANGGSANDRISSQPQQAAPRSTPGVPADIGNLLTKYGNR